MAALELAVASATPIASFCCGLPPPSVLASLTSPIAERMLSNAVLMAVAPCNQVPGSSSGIVVRRAYFAIAAKWYGWSEEEKFERSIARERRIWAKDE
ncbi:MAG: hypothetical protein WCD56_17235, partial [Pseudolabrys sp.]